LFCVLDVALETSGVRMIGAQQGQEAIESFSPPVAKGGWMKIALNDAPPCFDQIVDPFLNTQLSDSSERISLWKNRRGQGSLFTKVAKTGLVEQRKNKTPAIIIPKNDRLFMKSS
jgi:hypothetical protein